MNEYGAVKVKLGPYDGRLYVDHTGTNKAKVNEYGAVKVKLGPYDGKLYVDYSGINKAKVNEYMVQLK